MTEKKSSFKKYVISLWALFFLGVGGMVILFAQIAAGNLGFMPTFEELENPPNSFASVVYSEDSVVLRNFFYENRTYTEYKDIDHDVINALIATEDIRFREHSGIDVRGLLRVFKGVVSGDISTQGGGSTITQQLAKNLFPRESLDHKWELVVRKLREWVIAVKLEKSYTKDEILTMYLNKFDFLNLAVGIQSAAKIYFSTDAGHLDLHEAAMLVGMAKNPSYFNPVRRPELTRGRRNTVFNQMQKYGYLSRTECDSLKKLELGLNFKKADFKETRGTYLTEYLRTIMNARKPERKRYASWQTQKFKEDLTEWEINPLYGWCRKNTKPDGSKYNLYQDGLRIYSTINYKMQGYAEESLQRHLSEELQPVFSGSFANLPNAPFSTDLSNKEVNGILDNLIRQSERHRVLKARGLSFSDIKSDFNKPREMTVFSWKGDVDTTMAPIDSIKYYLGFLRSAMMTMDHRSGHVKTYIGGPNYRHFMFDMVKGGKRQVGSTVKPFLYTLAMQNGYSPCTKTLNIEYTFQLPDGKSWTPRNSGNARYGEAVTLEWGLANSVNNISAWIMQSFGDGGPAAMANVMRKMGIYSKIDVVPSMFLGTSEISIYEMVGAFGTFANHGVYTKPIFVSRIEDKNGNILANFVPEQKDAIDENTAYLMMSLLQNVVKKGTGGRLRRDLPYGNLTASIGGKTGTTQNHSDGWFIGITPELVTGVWSGADLRSIHFKSIKFGQGANMALPIYGYFMNQVYADTSLGYSQETEFVKPQGFNVNLDCNTSSDKEDENPVDQEEDDFF